MRPEANSAVLDEADLLSRARAVRLRAYAPYSGFKVGAVIVTGDGLVFEGVNVENAATPLGSCAERNAVAAMIAAGSHGPIVAIAIVGDGDDPCTPCGACRQVIFEFGREATVIASGDAGRPLVTSMGELLVHPFGPKRLAQGRTT